MAMRMPSRHSDTAILEIVSALRRRLRRLFLKAKEKYRNITIPFCLGYRRIRSLEFRGSNIFERFLDQRGLRLDAESACTCEAGGGGRGGPRRGGAGCRWRSPRRRMEPADSSDRPHGARRNGGDTDGGRRADKLSPAGQHFVCHAGA